jgi:hypothetical protein
MNQTTTEDLGTARLIDTHAHAFDTTDTRVVLVDADPATVLRAAERIDLLRTVVGAISALGMADRLALAPALIETSGRERVYGMAWRVGDGPSAAIDPRGLHAFDGPGYVKLIWDVRVEAGGETGTLLSTTTRAVATDDESRERLEEGWSVLAPVSAELSKRALAAIREQAEDEYESPSPVRIGTSASGRSGSGFALAA